MNWLYLILDLGSLSIPLIFSFHPKIKFYTKFKSFIPAMIISAGVYLTWDVYFTNQGYWGFNSLYLIGWSLQGLPLEEWLFFICIPYACVFTHYTLTSLYPNVTVSSSKMNGITGLLICTLIFAALLNIDKAYTFYNSMLTTIILVSTFVYKPYILRQFYYTFLVMLFPFFLINGILTGSFIDQEVVWYNNVENLGIRIFTIPIEDTFYALGLILLTIILTEVFGSTVKRNYN